MIEGQKKLMSTTKKQSRNTGKTKASKLQINKETLKDLGGSKVAQVKGGAIRCSYDQSGCGTA